MCRSSYVHAACVQPPAQTPSKSQQLLTQGVGTVSELRALDAATQKQQCPPRAPVLAPSTQQPGVSGGAIEASAAQLAAHTQQRRLSGSHSLRSAASAAEAAQSPRGEPRAPLPPRDRKSADQLPGRTGPSDPPTGLHERSPQAATSCIDTVGNSGGVTPGGALGAQTLHAVGRPPAAPAAASSSAVAAASSPGQSADPARMRISGEKARCASAPQRARAVRSGASMRAPASKQARHGHSDHACAASPTASEAQQRQGHRVPIEDRYRCFHGSSCFLRRMPCKSFLGPLATLSRSLNSSRAGTTKHICERDMLTGQCRAPSLSKLFSRVCMRCRHHVNAGVLANMRDHHEPGCSSARSATQRHVQAAILCNPCLLATLTCPLDPQGGGAEVESPAQAAQSARPAQRTHTAPHASSAMAQRSGGVVPLQRSHTAATAHCEAGASDSVHIAPSTCARPFSCPTLQAAIAVPGAIPPATTQLSGCHTAAATSEAVGGGARSWHAQTGTPQPLGHIRSAPQVTASAAQDIAAVPRAAPPPMRAATPSGVCAKGAASDWAERSIDRELRARACLSAPTAREARDIRHALVHEKLPECSADAARRGACSARLPRRMGRLWARMEAAKPGLRRPADAEVCMDMNLPEWERWRHMFLVPTAAFQQPRRPTRR